MMQNIKTAAACYLSKTLGRLDRYEDFVFWIRDREMTQQIYQGANFQKIWQRDPELIFKYPLIWLDYLEGKGKEFYMSQLQSRHNQNYTDSQKNYAIYQIIKPDGSIDYILDRCFKCIDLTNNIYIVGMAKKVPVTLWNKMFNEKIYMQVESDFVIQNELFAILKEHFGIVELLQSNFNKTELQQFHENILAKCALLTKREVECLYYLCLGKTAKEIAKQMLISPRTVETYIEQIRRKTGQQNRLEVISCFAKYCPNSPP
jgi:DNA-binding CsgD family transcriptional regulator